MPTHMSGGRDRDELPNTGPRDSQSKIFQALHSAQTQSLNNINEFMRQSIQSVGASTNQSLNESAIANAIAEYYMNGNQSMDSQQLKKVTEEMVINKINNIFDQVQEDNREFEESYQGLRKNNSSSNQVGIDTSI